MTAEKRNPPGSADKNPPVLRSEDEIDTEPLHAKPGRPPASTEPQEMTEREESVLRGVEKVPRKSQRASGNMGRVEFTFVRAMEERSNGEQVLLFRRHFEYGLSGLVVVKRLHNPRTFEHRQRLMEEVQLAFRLNHPAIAQVHHFKVINRLPHAIFEYVDGPTLQSLVTMAVMRGKPLPVPLALYVACEIADALHYAHTLRDTDGKPLGIVHRDVAPGNIRVDSTTGAVKLTDFGAAYSKRVGREESPAKLRKGDLMYSAPEYLRGAELDARSDVFALGLVLLEALTNRHFLAFMAVKVPEGEALAPDLEPELEPEIPLKELLALAEGYTPEDVERAMEHLSEGPRAIIRRALQRAPSERYATAEEMRQELRTQLVTLVPEYGRKEAVVDVAHVISEASAARHLGEPTEHGLYPEGFDEHEF